MALAQSASPAVAPHANRHAPAAHTAPATAPATAAHTAPHAATAARAIWLRRGRRLISGGLHTALLPTLGLRCGRVPALHHRRGGQQLRGTAIRRFPRACWRPRRLGLGTAWHCLTHAGEPWGGRGGSRVAPRRRATCTLAAESATAPPCRNFAPYTQVLRLLSLTLVADVAAGGAVVALRMEWESSSDGSVLREMVAGSAFDPSSSSLSDERLQVREARLRWTRWRYLTS
jgi:hypothetical protein